MLCRAAILADKKMRTLSDKKKLYNLDGWLSLLIFFPELHLVCEVTATCDSHLAKAPSAQKEFKKAKKRGSRIFFLKNMRNMTLRKTFVVFFMCMPSLALLWWWLWLWQLLSGVAALVSEHGASPANAASSD